MTKEQFHREKMYCCMRSERLISPEEYERVERIFLEKYKTLIGTVYAGIPLTPCPS